MLVGGLVGFGAYKMSKKDADRIEQQTGVPPEELTDEELEQSMDQLGIEKQKIDENDREVGQDQGAPAGEGAPAPSGSSSELGDIEKLAELRDQGILTDEEFEAKKKQILGL